MKNFKKKSTAIYIIGGLGLIGKEIVKKLLNKELKVVVLDMKVKINIGNLYYEKFDISKTNHQKKKLTQIFNIHGLPKILVNTSYPKTRDWKKNSFNNLNFKSYKKNIDLHLNSYIWTTKIFADIMRKFKVNGSIVNLASIYGFLGQDKSLYENINNISENVTYPVIKGGIINSCRSMAAHYGKYNIRINTVSPGGVFDNQNKKFVKRYKKKTPLNRLASPLDVANAVAFLSSDDASYITGVNLVVDGGYSII